MQQRTGATAKYRLSCKQNEYIFNGTGGAVIPSMGVAGTNVMSSCKSPIDLLYECVACSGHMLKSCHI